MVFSLRHTHRCFCYSDGGGIRQYHDGFAWGEDYPSSYNNLAKAQVKSGRVADTGCPNGMLGVGVLGL